MRLVGQEIAARFQKKHTDARTWLETWVKTVQSATWEDIEDVRKTYPHADGVKLKSGTVVTVFNCKGNEYRLLCNLSYVIQTVQVLDIMPHSAYSKDLWKARY